MNKNLLTPEVDQNWLLLKKIKTKKIVKIKNINFKIYKITCPWPSDIVIKSVELIFLSSENLIKLNMGSVPGDNIKINGVQQFESLYESSKSNDGGSMYF